MIHPNKPSGDHDVRVLIDMLPSGLGGRREPIERREWFCRLRIEGHFFEVRLVSADDTFIPGHRTEAKATFLNWAAAADLIRANVSIEIWELGRVAIGHVKGMVSAPNHATL